MIVQCPSCASRYRIRDANIPPSGGKIRCPSCSHAFIVYPESDDDGDKTNITSQGEISSLINKMEGQAHSGLAPQDEDYVSTQISTTDQARAVNAMANELGDPMDMDGTVEIQNPMKVWKQAQNAMQQQQAQQQQAPPPADDDDEWDDFAATEVVDPSSFTFPAPSASPNLTPSEAVMPPTAEVSREELADAFGVRATSGMQAILPPSAGGIPHPNHVAQQQQQQQQPQHQAQPQSYQPQYNAADSSGQYAPSTPNTPPGGRSTHDSWDQVQQPGTTEPHEQVNAFAQPQVHNQNQTGNSGFQRSPSGLSSAALFDDPIPDDDPVNSNLNMPSPFADASSSGLHQQPQHQHQHQHQQQQQQPPPQHQPMADAGQGGEHPGPWKLKTNFGLTYEFPDTKGLRSWLSSREELDGFTVSADDGASFHALSAFPHLQARRSASAAGRAPMQPPSHGSGSFDQPQFGWGPASEPSTAGVDPAYGSGLHQQSESGIKGPRINNEYRPPSRESKGRGLLWLVFLILLVAAVVIALETTGVFKVSDLARDAGLLPAKEATTTGNEVDETNSKVPTPEVVDPAKLAEKQALELEQLLEDTERLIEGNKLPAALERLDKLEQLAPTNPLVFDMRGQVLDKLGKADEAEAARAKANELRGTDAPAADAGVVEPGDEPAEEPK